MRILLTDLPEWFYPQETQRAMASESHLNQESSRISPAGALFVWLKLQQLSNKLHQLYYIFLGKIGMPLTIKTQFFQPFLQCGARDICAGLTTHSSTRYLPSDGQGLEVLSPSCQERGGCQRKSSKSYHVYQHHSKQSSLIVVWLTIHPMLHRFTRWFKQSLNRTSGAWTGSGIWRV